MKVVELFVGACCLSMACAASSVKAAPIISVDVPIAQPLAVAFSPDGRQAAVGGTETIGNVPNDGVVALVDVETGTQKALLRHSGAVKLASGGSSASMNIIHDLAYAPDGKLLAVAAELGLHLWNTADGSESATLVGDKPKEYVGGISSATFSPDGKLLAATLGWKSKVGLWDADTSARLREIEGSGHADLAFTADSLHLVSAEHGNLVRLWRVSDGRQLTEVHAQMGPLYGVAIDPAGKLLAAVGEGGEKMWRLGSTADDQWRFTDEVQLVGQTGPVQSVAFSPDGKLLVTSSASGVVMLYDVETRAVCGALWAGGPCAFSPDGERLAVAETVRGRREPKSRFSIWRVADLLDGDRLAEQSRMAAETLIRIASSDRPNYDAQPRTIAVLAVPQAAAAAPALIDALTDPKIKRKKLVAMGLGRIAAVSREAVAALTKALREDPDVDGRTDAALALSMTTPEAAEFAVPALTDAALNDASPAVQRIALRALEKIDPIAFRETVTKLRARGPVRAKVEKRNDEFYYQDRSLDDWMDRLTQCFIPNEIFGRPSPQEPLAAIRAMGADAVPTLMKALESTEWSRRQAAAAGLEILGPAAAVNAGVSEAELQQLIRAAVAPLSPPAVAPPSPPAVDRAIVRPKKRLLLEPGTVKAWPTGATPIEIRNPSFEDDKIADGKWLGGQISGWTNVTREDFAYGAQNPTDAHFAKANDADGRLSVVPDGANVAFSYGWGRSRGSTIAQVLQEVLRPDTRYYLNVEVGNRLDTKMPKYKVQLLAGGKVLAGDDNMLRPKHGEFLTSRVEYVSDDRPAQLGNVLEIRLSTFDMDDSTGWTQAEFDHVRLVSLPTAEANERPSISLAWPHGKPEDRWLIARAPTPAGPFSVVGQVTGGEGAFVDSDARLQPATTYYYQVEGDGAQSTVSAVIGVTTLGKH
ncbi:hypothetical protein [Bythopirellula polymerisocia]|uniref:WD domain, G-beta repeat n=1 Tax=Bythopirellula polymerisocia TaxID=2528003 RepID=A0A5C6D3Q0_9BACT|nr:hypothetical protein [Bythopirellula polymerisocia]TWU29489.1 WD domain, G-beta repeat [Bythopirellula polymerisocia]